MTIVSLPPDREVIERVRSGDAEILERLMANYWGDLVRYADGILGGSGDGQDVVQEAFIRFWSRRERWGAEGSVKALLYTVTRNAAIDERRKGARGATVRLDPETPSRDPSPYDQVREDELRRAAAVAVDRLPPKRQEVFRLIREGGLTYKEVATVLGLSAQTVANQMSLALADLRKALETVRLPE